MAVASKHRPRQLLIDDADKPMKWYKRLAKAWRMSVETEKPFVNPLKPEILHWRA